MNIENKNSNNKNKNKKIIDREIKTKEAK